MTIVGFVPTRFPRVVERLVLNALRRFVVLPGRETVRLPLNALSDVCVASEREVTAHGQVFRRPSIPDFTLPHVLLLLTGKSKIGNRGSSQIYWA